MCSEHAHRALRLEFWSGLGHLPTIAHGHGHGASPGLPQASGDHTHTTGAESFQHAVSSPSLPTPHLTNEDTEPQRDGAAWSPWLLRLCWDCSLDSQRRLCPCPQVSPCLRSCGVQQSQGRGRTGGKGRSVEVDPSSGCGVGRKEGGTLSLS